MRFKHFHSCKRIPNYVNRFGHLETNDQTRITLVLLLTHWGRVTHICLSKLFILGSDNGLSPGRRQAIIWTKDGILLIRTLGTNFSEILIKINAFSLKKLHLKMLSGKWRPSCFGLNVLRGNKWTTQSQALLERCSWSSKIVIFNYEHQIANRQGHWIFYV